MSGLSCKWATRMLRGVAGIMMLSAGAMKLAYAHADGTWMSVYVYYLVSVIELIVGLGALASNRPWAMWGGGVLASGILVINMLYFTDPRPCGCFGPIRPSVMVRIWYAGVLGACCAFGIGLRQSQVLSPAGSVLSKSCSGESA